MNDEHATLLADVTLKNNLPCSAGLNSGDTFYIEFGSYTVTGGTITINSGISCVTDKNVDGLFVTSGGATISGIDNGNGTYTYTTNLPQ
jgi:hypothetical protein